MLRLHDFFFYVKASVGLCVYVKLYHNLWEKWTHMQKYMYGRLHLQQTKEPNKNKEKI